MWHSIIWGLVRGATTLSYLVLGAYGRSGALRSGSVEATSLSPEFGQVVVSEGYRVLLNTTKENVPFQSSGMVVARTC